MRERRQIFGILKKKLDFIISLFNLFSWSCCCCCCYCCCCCCCCCCCSYVVHKMNISDEIFEICKHLFLLIKFHHSNVFFSTLFLKNLFKLGSSSSKNIIFALKSCEIVVVVVAAAILVAILLLRCYCC